MLKRIKYLTKRKGTKMKLKINNKQIIVTGVSNEALHDSVVWLIEKSNCTYIAEDELTKFIIYGNELQLIKFLKNWNNEYKTNYSLKLNKQNVSTKRKVIKMKTENKKSAKSNKAVVKKTNKKNVNKKSVVRNVVMLIKKGTKKLYYANGAFETKSAKEARAFRYENDGLRLLTNQVEEYKPKANTYNGSKVLTETL